MRSDLLAEAKAVLQGRPVLDGVFPVLVFGVLATRSVPVAATAAVAVAALILVWRRWRGGSTGWALGGIAGVALAAGLALATDDVGAYHLPGIARAAGLAVLSLVSLWLPLPIVAWSSKLFRRWPTAWYRHPSIRPAYVETSVAWAVFFALRALAQWLLLDAGAMTQTIAALLLGWPATTALLLGTYVYGSWRLAALGGPSAEEWSTGQPAPQRGF